MERELIILFAVVVILFSNIGIYLWLRAQYKRTRRFGVIVRQELARFVELCSPSRKFTDDEVRKYVADNAENIIYSQKILRKLYILPKTKEKFKFSLFVDRFNNIKKYQEENNRIHTLIEDTKRGVHELLFRIDNLNKLQEYQSHFAIESLKSHSKEILLDLDYLKKHKLLKYTNEEENFKFVADYRSIIQQENISKHNENCVIYHKAHSADFFDNVLKYPLDDQQRDAILHLEDNTLVISSAGSGKTSTMVGKARYMVEKLNVDPKRILIITYTRKAAGELSDRLGIEGLSCQTFHAIALKIIAELTNSKPSICPPDFMLNAFYKLMKNNEDFLDAIVEYILNKRSLMKREHEYNTSYEYYADRRKYGVMAMFPDMDGNIIFTKSEEEKRICEWLSIHDVPFRYEEAYEFETSDNKYRQYRPDFSIYYTDEQGKNKRIYLEHFAIDKNSKVPLWFGTDYNSGSLNDEDIVRRWEKANRDYNDGIRWKRSMHEFHNTALINTTSAMFQNGTVWDILAQQLQEYGIKTVEHTAEELYNRIVTRNHSLERSVFKLIEQFATLRKSNLVDLGILISKAKEENDDRSYYIIDKVMRPFINFYESEMKEQGYIDFTDAILQAKELCETNTWLDYEYILVDEFQDISKDRYLFLKSMRKANEDCFTKLFCVGDDWQSIYRFSGSDMALFNDFENYFGYTKHCKIETTYRFHNPVINISSTFIQTNPNQVKKQIREFFVKSDEYIEIENRYLAECENLPSIYDDLEAYEDGTLKEKCKLQFDAANALEESLEELRPKTFIKLHEYSTEKEEKTKVENLIRQIPVDEDILIIGRYNYDAGSVGFRFTPQDADKKTIWLTLAGRKVRFMSVHGSKGLEADHVILLNCNRGVNGFPSLIEDDPILNFVLSDKDQFENGEERRVFYVAITRAKKNMHVFYCDRTPSPFVDEIKELIHDEKEDSENRDIIPCPVCGNGQIIPIKEGTSSRGPWVLLGCTNHAAQCPYFKLVDKAVHDREVESFNTRNDVAPVQEHSKARYDNIKECFANVEDKRKQYNIKYV